MNYAAIVLTHPETGEELFFPSVRSAAKKFGVVDSAFRSAIERGHLCQGYMVKRIGEKKARAGMANICFDCQKACGGCSWSEIDPDTGKPRFQPVEGWTAKPVVIQVENGRAVEGYHVTACPEFVKDEPRKTVRGGGLTLEQMEILIRHWIERGEL